MPTQQVRIWIAVSLACCAIALFVLSRLTGHADPSVTPSVSSRNVAAASAAVLGEVEAVAAKFHIARTAMRIVFPAKGAATVPEVRLQVGPDFSSYEFHCALAAAMSDMDVCVTGTENVRAKTTTLRIARDSAAIVLVNLDMRSPLQQPRKESSH